MTWWDRLTSRPAAEGVEREQDEQALADLRTSFDRVSDRTDRLIAAYKQAERQMLRRRKL